MAGPSRQKRRQLMITKALLLGYEFKWYVFSPKGCYLRKPDGMWYCEDKPMLDRNQMRRLQREDRKHHWLLNQPVAFPAVWVAAKKALELTDAEIARTNSGADSSSQ